MNAATVAALVEDLNHGLQDTTRTQQEFDETVEHLARAGLWVEVSLVPLTAGTHLYTLPDNALVLLHAFYDDRQLDRERVEDMDIMPGWRDHRGAPLAYVQADEADRTFRLYPIPTVASKAYVPLYGEPLGRDYPSYTAAVLTTYRRTSFQPWLGMYAALKVSALEFTRDGKQRDEPFAKACADVASFVAMLLA